MTTLSPPPDAISMAAAARLVRVDGKPISPTTIWRWIRKGKLGVKLASWRIGGRIVTTEAAVREFEQAVTEADARRWADRAGEPIVTPTQLDVEARAEALGI